MFVDKDIFFPASVVAPDGERYTFTAADVRRTYANGVGQLGADPPLAVPGIWEHDARAEMVPMTAFLSAMNDYDEFRDWAVKWVKGAYGHVAGYGLKETADRGPVMYARLWVNDDADADKLVNARFVSCRLDANYQTPDGRVWPGWSVNHVAATPRPVLVNQQPFSRSAMLSAGNRFPRATVYLSLEGAKMAADDDDKGGDKKKPDNTPGQGDALGRCLTALTTLLGKPLPDSVVDIDTLALALEMAAALKGSDLGGADDLDEFGLEDTEQAAGGAPVMMSSLSPEQVRAHKIMEAGERAKRVATATKVGGILAKAGRIPAAKAAALVKEAQTVSLSMLANGRWTSPLDARLSDLTDVARTFTGGKAGRRAGRVDLSQTVGIGIPDPPAPDGRDKTAKAARVAAAVEAAENRVTQGMGGAAQK